jgi:hypothetical protein
VVALLSALNANLYGASRMLLSLAQRDEAPKRLAGMSRRKVPWLAVLASVLFGFVAAVLELVFPNKVLPALLNIVGATCLMVWTISLLSQLVLRAADRAGTPLPFRMAGYPWLTLLGLAVLAVIYVLIVLSRRHPHAAVSMLALTLVIAAVNAASRRGPVEPRSGAFAGDGCAGSQACNRQLSPSPRVACQSANCASRASCPAASASPAAAARAPVPAWGAPRSAAGCRRGRRACRHGPAPSASRPRQPCQPQASQAVSASRQPGA